MHITWNKRSPSYGREHEWIGRRVHWSVQLNCVSHELFRRLLVRWTRDWRAQPKCRRISPICPFQMRRGWWLWCAVTELCRTNSTWTSPLCLSFSARSPREKRMSSNIFYRSKFFLFTKIKRDHQSTSTLFTGTLFHCNSYLKLIRSWPHLATSLKRYFLRPKRPDPLDISWSHLKFFQAASWYSYDGLSA